MRLHPEDKKVHNSMGIALAELGRTDDACYHFEQSCRIMEASLIMDAVNLKFAQPELEEEFASRRTQLARLPTRLLLSATLLTAVWDMCLIVFGEEPVHISANDRHQYDIVFLGIELTTSIVTLVLTWHSKFFRYKPLVLTCYIVVYFVVQLLMAWLALLAQSDHGNDHDIFVIKCTVPGGDHKGGVNPILYSSFNNLVRDLAVSLALPQLCGLRWTAMPVIFLVYAVTYGVLAYLSPSLTSLLDPTSMLGIMSISVLVAYWAEKAERKSFVNEKLYATEKTCRAESEKDWRREAAERHRSEIAKTSAQIELNTRRQFVAWIFHEIRNPLNAMFGAIQMLGTTAKAKKEKEWVSMAEMSAEMVSNVLNDVLCLSKIEEGNLELHKELFTLADAVQSVRFMFIELAAKSSINLECHIAPDVPRSVYADEVRLKEVLANVCLCHESFTINMHACFDRHRVRFNFVLTKCVPASTVLLERD